MNQILSYGSHDALSYGNKLKVAQSCMIFIWGHQQHTERNFLLKQTISEIQIFAQNEAEPLPLRCLKRENSLILRLIDIPEATYS